MRAPGRGLGRSAELPLEIVGEFVEPLRAQLRNGLEHSLANAGSSAPTIWPSTTTLVDGVTVIPPEPAVVTLAVSIW